MTRVRTFLTIEALAFWTAALVHAGVLLEGYRHREAMIAESVIGGVLALGLLVSVISSEWTRGAGLAAQGFALLGTFVGLFTMVIGVGPQSLFDVMLHAGFVAVLISGLVVAARQGTFGALA
jgi:hypothetical protein